MIRTSAPSEGLSTLNFHLETINGAIGILTLAVIVVLTIYLVTEKERRGLPWHVAMYATLLAGALYIEKVGAFSNRFVVWLWRFQTGGLTPMSDFQIEILIWAAVVTAAGLLMLIAVLSRPRHGNLPWILSALTAGAYVLWSYWSR